MTKSMIPSQPVGMFMVPKVWLALSAALLPLAGSRAAGDVVEVRTPNGVMILEGRVVAEDPTGTILLEGRDLQHYVVSARERVRWERTKEDPPLWDRKELRAQLAAEFGPRFRLLETNNYLVVYSCSQEAAREASTLLERAYSVFTNYFKRQGGFELQPPKQPLVAVMCGSRQEYLRFASRFLGPLASTTAGIYSQGTNRMYLFNEFGGGTDVKLRTLATVDPRGAEQAAADLYERNVSKIIHEAIHQIAHNTGFHNRTVSNPLWLVEGMAMFFESPSLDAKGGWGGVGNVNRERLLHFAGAPGIATDAMLQRLVVDDALLRESDTALDGYAAAWAFTYYLAKTKNRAYMKYVKIMNERPPLTPYTPEERLRDFRTAFGKAPTEFGPEFRRYMQRLVSREQGGAGRAKGARPRPR